MSFNSAVEARHSILTQSESTVLKVLSSHTPSPPPSSSPPPLASEVRMISEHSGIRSNDEVLRALYALEGKALVSPEPEGDFTSRWWKITELGRRAARLLESPSK